MTQSPSAQPLVISDLRAQFNGNVVAPGDDDYDRARVVFPGDIDAHPAVIIQPTSASEVAQVVKLARDTGLELAMRSGGHFNGGLSVVDDGIVLDLAKMKALDIDVESRTAWAQTGVTAGEYTNAAAEHSLATGFGDTGSVGIGGITLGGGVGFLSRKFGMTIDHVIAAEIVTADGSILAVNADNHADLFWAIRGGGGNFGVVTKFEYRLHEVPGVVGGMLMLPATAEALQSVITAARTAPDELSGIINVMPAPPLPFIPAEHHGKIIIMALLCYAGDAEDGEKALAPFRAAATPLADMLRPMPYTGMFQPGDDDFHPTAAVDTIFMDDFGHADAETIIEQLAASDAPVRITQLRVLGGAIDEVAPDATAYAHRGSAIMVNLTALYLSPEDKAAKQAWVDDLSAKLCNDTPGAYVNFTDPHRTDPQRVYPGQTWVRLSDVKAKYDPENLFRRNVNVPPAAA
jgi:FAD/FMN-containing dehydrogenase